MGDKTELRIIPQLNQGVRWSIGDDGEVIQAINAGSIDLTNGQGKSGRRYPPSNEEKIDTPYKMKAAFGNMLTALSWLEEIIREPGWRKHDPELCAVGAVAGWLMLAKRIAQQNLAALRKARLRLSGSVCLDDATSGSSFSELAVSETSVRLDGVMQMFKPSAAILRSPKVTQLAFYSESLRGIDGKIEWPYPEIQCERLYRHVEIELENLADSTTILPSDLRTAIHFLTTVLDDLLCWSVHPDPQPLSEAWLTSVKSGLVDKTDSAIRSAEHAGDAALVTKIKRARKLGFEFATLLCDRPVLSTVPVEQWTVPKHRRLFDDLDSLNAEFHQLAELTPDLIVGELDGRPKTDGSARPKTRVRRTGDAGFKPEQLEAVRNIIRLNPNMKTKDIKSKLEEAGGTGIGNDRLQKVLDYIRVTYPGEYSVPIRRRRKDA